MLLFSLLSTDLISHKLISGDKVSVLKAAIQETDGTPADLQRLFVGAQLLQDDDEAGMGQTPPAANMPSW